MEVILAFDAAKNGESSVMIFPFLKKMGSQLEICRWTQTFKEGEKKRHNETARASNLGALSTVNAVRPAVYLFIYFVFRGGDGEVKRRTVKRERAQFLVRVHAISDGTRNALRRCRYLVPLPKITFSAKKKEKKNNR